MSVTRPAGPSSAVGAEARATRVDRLTWRLALGNLAAQVAIILTGGAVRLTGSGLGCSQWPMCEPGAFTPVFQEQSSIHPYIEFGNRTMTGVLTLIAVALVWAVYRRRPTAHRPARLRRLAWWPLAGIALQALLGGVTVWVDLHPAIVGSHMLISLALVAVSTYLVLRLAAPDAPPRPVASPSLRNVGWAVAALGVVVLVLGTIVTGTGPHSGDAEEPCRWALDPVAISRLHALAVWVFLALVVTGLVLARPGGAAFRAWGWLLGVTLLQGLGGYVQYLSGLPELLVGLHMLGAALLVIALVVAVGSLRRRSPQPPTLGGP